METDKPDERKVVGWGIAGKFIIYILLFSSAITFILTGIQLYLDYRYGLDSIKRSIHQIEESYLGGVTSSLWVSDMDFLEIQLQGLMKLNDMQYIGVEHDNEIIIKFGTLKKDRVIKKEFLLSHTYKNKESTPKGGGIVITPERG